MADPAEDAPLDPASFAACLTPLLTRQPSALVLAVSGGPDSVALMGLMARLGAQRSLPPLAVGTVDHGLRAGAAAEAEGVVAQAASLGLPAYTLHWQGPKPARAIQAKARQARYALLGDLCERLGADHLVTAHTQDDQAETVLFRLARGSGPAGLGAMHPFTPMGRGLTLARPLLGVGRRRLSATCRAEGWSTVSDPANEDPRFARARIRRLLPHLAPEGMDAATLARLAARARRAEEALGLAASDHERRLVTDTAAGCRLDMASLAGLPHEFTIRLLARAITRIGGRAPRLDRLEVASAHLREAADARQSLARTLGGCLLRLDMRGALAISHEPPRRAPCKPL